MAQLPKYGLSCGNAAVQVEPMATPLCGEVECDRYYFQVRLVSLQSIAGDPAAYLLIYDRLSLTLQVGTDPIGGLSSVNWPQTAGCLNTAYEGSLGFDPDGSVTLLLEGECDGSNLCTPAVTFVKYGSEYRADLFILAIDGMPGEDVTFDLAQFYYSSSFGQCNDNVGFDAPDFAVPEHSGDFTAVEIVFGDFDPGEALLPVDASNDAGANITAEYLSVLLSMETQNSMHKPKLLNFVVPPVAQSVDPVPGTDNWRIFVRFDGGSGITVPANSRVTLFDIEVRGPENESLAAGADVCFEHGVFRRTGLPCLNASFPEACKGIEFLGHDPCDPGHFTVEVTGLGVGSSCEELSAKVSLGWHTYSPSLDFDQIRIAVEFDLPAGVSITGIGENTFGCPANPACLPSGGFADCFKISGNRVTFCLYPVTAHEVSSGSYFTVEFNVPQNCVNSATVREALVDVSTDPPGGGACVPSVHIDNDFFPMCSPLLAGWVKNVNGAYVDDVNVAVSRTTSDPECPPVSVWPNNGPWSWCACDQALYRVEPEVRHDEDGWLNGVTTYDLVLIDRHLNVPGNEFTSIYQYAAADADDSKNITYDASMQTGDIAEFRKLILGVIEATSGNRSWRYFDENDPGALPMMPPSGSFTRPAEHVNANPANTSLGFVAVKVGDVNHSHLTDIEARPAKVAGLVAEAPAGKLTAGSLVEVPVRYEGGEAVCAAQFALRFDPSRWELAGVASADVGQVWEHNFDLSRAAEGELRFAWHTALAEEQARGGQAFFRLALRPRADTEAGPGLLALDGGRLRCLAYGPEGEPFALRMACRAQERRDLPEAGLRAVCSPNPGQGEVSLAVTGHGTADRVLLTVFDAFGQRLLRREVPLSPGVPAPVRVPEAAAWPAGLYTWRLKAGGQSAEGRFLKQ